MLSHYPAFRIRRPRDQPPPRRLTGLLLVQREAHVETFHQPQQEPCGVLRLLRKRRPGLGQRQRAVAGGPSLARKAEDAVGDPVRMSSDGSAVAARRRSAAPRGSLCSSRGSDSCFDGWGVQTGGVSWLVADRELYGADRRVSTALLSEKRPLRLPYHDCRSGSVGNVATRLGNSLTHRDHWGPIGSGGIAVLQPA